MTNEKAIAAAKDAFRNQTMPFVRQIVSALAIGTTEALSQVRQSLRLWLRHFDTNYSFPLALEQVLGHELARGLTSHTNLKASLADILDRTNSREILPTSMSSADITTLSSDLRANSIFSARTTNAGYLRDMATVLDEFLSGKINTATARLKLLTSLDTYGYTAADGFPGDNVPPAEAGSLRDLASESRIKLILDTQAQLAFGRGQKISGDETAATFPAWELVRILPRAVPRGYKETKDGLVPVPGDSWQDRFKSCGGKLHGGRMIALKDSPVWEDLGSAALFDDALDTDHPPFAFNSGMGWLPVDRGECLDLGIIKPDHKPKNPAAPRFDERPPVDFKDFPTDLREQLRADLARARADAAASLARDFKTEREVYAQ